MSGKRIVFCTLGSLGDLYPILALAREMQRRGHSPAVATTPVYRRLVEAENVEFHPVRPDLEADDPHILRRVMDRNTGGRYIIADLILPALRDSYEDTAAAAANADLLVTHPLAFSALLFARKIGMPWASLALAPVSMYSVYDPSVLVGLPFAEWLASCGPMVQRGLLRTMAFLSEPMWKPFRKFEEELGLPPAPNPLFWGHSPQLALGCSRRSWRLPRGIGRPTHIAPVFPSSSIARETSRTSSVSSTLGSHPSCSRLARRRSGSPAIFFSKAPRRHIS